MGCSEQQDILPFEEGKKYPFDMNVKISGMEITTRAFRDNVTDFPPLWVVIFDDNGYLVEYAKATNFVREGDITHFSVTLTATSQPRIAHLLLNYVDDSVEDLELEYGHENNVIGSMSVSDDRDVYWQRVFLPSGINEASINTSMVDVPLLRNFLKISMTNNCNYFALSGFYVINVPNEGTVAPYVDGNFFDWKTSKEYSEVVNLGYAGIMPDGVTFKNKDLSSLSWQLEPFFLYEKPFDNNSSNAENTLTVLLKGTYKNGQAKRDTYYKVDIVYKEGGINYYYHLLRNFAYNILIEEVTGDGALTPEEALRGAANNNLSSSVNLKDLSNISDGTSTLYVSYTDTTLTTTDVIYLKFKYIPDMSKDNVVRNDLVDFTRKNDAIFEVIDFNNTAVDSEGWSIMTLKPKNIVPVAEVLENIVLYVGNLSREVTFRLRPKYDMLVECIPSIVEEKVGEDLLVNVKIPNDLNKVLFPLDIELTAVSRNEDGSKLPYISPNNSEHISVQMINGKLYFIKTISYSEYLTLDIVDNLRILPYHFVTNIERSASNVYAYNRYFNEGRDYFRNRSDSYINTIVFEGSQYYGVGNSVVTKITANKSGQYELSSESLDINENVVNITANNVYSMTSNTTTWDDPAMLAIGYNYDGDEVLDTYISSVERNMLKIKASYTKSIDNTLFDATELSIYTSQDDAQNGKNLVGKIVNSVLKYTGSEVKVSGLEENSMIWFAYTSGMYVYTASTTAGELYNKTAVLEFGNPITIKPEISNIKWTDADYYGVGKTVTLTFETTLPTLEYSINTTSSNLSLTSTTIEGNTVTMKLTTQTWSDVANVMIAVLGSDVQQITGPTRNKLTIKLTASGSTPSTNTQVTMSVANVSERWSNWTKGKTITVNGLNSNTSITFSYTSWWTTYAGSTTAQNLANGTVNINFRQ